MTNAGTILGSSPMPFSPVGLAFDGTNMCVPSTHSVSRF